MCQKVVILSRSNDLYYNLALEELLLNHYTDQYDILFIYRSKSAIVLGKHQNPYNEFDLDSLYQGSGLQIGRRITGGGTVYHDLGNLNFAFITDKNKFNIDQNYQLLLDILKLWKINAWIKNRHIFVNDHKISGHAFAYKKESAIHHGTMLIKSDLDQLKQLLKPPSYEVQDRAVLSERQGVKNLIDINDQISIFRFIRSFINSYFVEKGYKGIILNAHIFLDDGRFFSLYEKMKSDEWIYGYTGAFELLLNIHFEGEMTKIKIALNKNGKIEIKSIPKRSYSLIAFLIKQRKSFHLNRLINHYSSQKEEI